MNFLLQNFRFNIFAIAMLTCIPTISLAQGELHGKIIDAKGNPIDAATIIVQDRDSSIVGSCLSDTCGLFYMPNIKIPYILIVHHLAYNAYITTDSTYTPTIILEEATNTLGEVTVKSSLPMHVNNDGSLRYNGKLLAVDRPIRNALDLLEEIPTIQKTGNEYSIVGASSFTILINGKRSGMTQEQLLAYLSSLPSERVEHIDLYYNTPAKFGVRGASVNIVFANNRKNSLEANGNAYGEIGKHRNHEGNGGINVGLSSKKWAFHIGYAGNYKNRRKVLQIETNHFVTNTLYHVSQKSVNRTRSWDNNLYADADWTLNDNSSIKISYIMQEEKPSISSHASTSINLSSNLSETTTKNSTWLHHITGAYSYKNIELGVISTFYNQKEKQNLAESNENELSGIYSQRSSNFSAYLNGKLRVFGNDMFFGIKGNIASTSNGKDVTHTGIFSDESFKFAQKEQTCSAYIGYGHSIAKKGFINLSIEGEYFRSSYKKNDEKECTLWNQWQLYPSLTMTYRPCPTGNIQLALSCERHYPSYWTTASNRTYINSYCASEGNTSLKPFSKYSGNLNYIIRSKYILGIFAESSPDYFTQQMTLSDSELLASYKYFNLDQSYRYGIMVIAPIQWSGNALSRITTMAFNMHQKGDFENGIIFSKKKTSAMIRMANNFSFFKKKLNIEFTGWYQSPIIQGYYQVARMYSFSTGITWRTGIDGLSVIVKGEDIFNTYRMKTKCNIENMKFSFNNNIDMQAFFLTIHYTFNGYKEHKKEKINSSRLGL